MLAKAVGQAAYALIDTTPSRASPLPQRFMPNPEIAFN